MTTNRRQFLKKGVALSAWAALPAATWSGLSHASPRPIELTPSAFNTQLDPNSPVKTGVWSFNQQFPGPPLRFKRGENVHITVKNELQQETGVHWHGLRVPNEMDGVPNVTQKPIPPGGSFDYKFKIPDSGTFWYHPHQSSFEQVPRGLYGALIVEEDEPPIVDQDVAWVLSDIKLNANRQQVEDFGRIYDVATVGRLGNQSLVNGLVAGAERKITVRSGERLRLRLINTSSARFFTPAIAGHTAQIIAYDGQAVTPHPMPTTGLELGPGSRVDLMIDCMHKPGETFSINDMGITPGSQPTQLGTLAYSSQKPVRSKPLNTSIILAPNQLPEPNLDRASLRYVVFQGGIGGMPMIGRVDGKESNIKQMIKENDHAWTLNYTGQHELDLMMEPFMHLKLGEHVIMRMINETDFVHPMHLHGHFFRVLSINNKKTPHQEWRDTVVLQPGDTIDVAFVADNEGVWMYHCHILAHAAGGMMGTIAVS